jgi:hypothetical protein
MRPCSLYDSFGAKFLSRCEGWYRVMKEVYLAASRLAPNHLVMATPPLNAREDRAE